jgi:hypothetical protein
MEDIALDQKYQLAFTVLEMVSPIVGIVLAWLGTRLAKLVNTKIKNETFAGVMTRLNDSVFTLVKEAEQTMVDGLKAARQKESPGGDLITKAEAQVIKQHVLDKFKGLWGAAGLAELGAVLSMTEKQVEDHVASKIEAAVLDLKLAKSGN